MAIGDFDTYKPLQVVSTSGTPTISKAIPVKITSGKATTGTGEIVIDWTNVSSQTDIGIYDENNILMDYYFESFNTVSNSAIVWVYDSWVRDGTEQLRVAYGNGLSDQSSIANTVFINESGLYVGWLLNESSGAAIDVMNNYDGTVTGTSQGVSTLLGNGYTSDGVDDHIDYGTPINVANVSVFEVWIKTTDNDKYLFGARNGDYWMVNIEADGTLRHGLNDGTNYDYSSSNTAIDDGNWHHVVIAADVGGTTYHFVDGTQVGSFDTSAISALYPSNNAYLAARNAPSLLNKYVNATFAHAFLYTSMPSSDDVQAKYDAGKPTPDFFNQQLPPTTEGNAIFHGINF